MQIELTDEEGFDLLDALWAAHCAALNPEFKQRIDIIRAKLVVSTIKASRAESERREG